MVKFEAARVNVWSIAGFGILLATTAFGWGVTYATLSGELSSLSREVQEIKTQIQPFPQTQFQVGRLTDVAAENRARIDANMLSTNERIDRIVNSIDNRLNSIVDAVNTINTRVEVITTRLPERSE